MKILFWTPPWAAHGDPLFYRNCLKKHLIPQANLLAASGCDVTVVLPELLKSEEVSINSSIKVISLSIADHISIVGSLTDPSLHLYKKDDQTLIDRMASGLSRLLERSYDAILLWETPVPFFEKAFPDALIIHQMPGAFSRPPYPHTVTFDPVGLYKHGSLYKFSSEIQNEKIALDAPLAEEFSRHVRSSINAVQPFDYKQLRGTRNFNKLILLPLQVSAHYSFLADTSYENQADFLLDVLQTTPSDVGVIVTQYITPRVKDTVLNTDVLASLRAKWPNLIHRPEFDTIPSVSQYLLPLVDEVTTCSSSLGLQAMSWGRTVSICQDTFLGPYASDHQTGEERAAKYTSTLAFLLGRNQPLASAVIDDKNFLLPLLEEMLARKRGGVTGIDLMPAFSSIDRNYAMRLFESFNPARALKSFQKTSTLPTAKQIDLGKFNRFAKQDGIKALTFDVFDTLIKRPMEVPADAYKLLEQKALELTGGIAEDFARIRLNAEVETREKSKKGEITLDEIYQAIQSFYGLTDELTEQIKQTEIELEISLVQPRSMGRQLWQIATNTGKSIYLVSDMYLPREVLFRMLAKANYHGYRKLFLSCDYGVRKKEGGLYDAMLSELRLSGNEVLHVGDNKIADIEQAEARGMKTFRVPRAIDRMRGSPYYKEIYPPKAGAGERARSAIAGLTAHALFDEPSGDAERTSLFQGNPSHIGYAALGPMLTGYMLWLGRQAKRDGISRLFFLSREGWLLKQIYEALHVSDPKAVPARYLYASRRATRLASISSKGDLLALASHPFQSTVKVGELLYNRFGLSCRRVTAQMWKAAGYSGPNEELESNSNGRVKFSLLCTSLLDQILVKAKKEREIYCAYLTETGFTDEPRPAVVDIGWQANMQGSLGVLLGKPLDGYYYATLQGALLWKTRGHRIWAYAGDMLSHGHPSASVINRRLLEYLTCHTEPSLLRLQRSSNGIVPIFRQEEDLLTRRSLIESIHQGAIQFAVDFEQGFGNVMEQLWIDPFLGERVFAAFAKSPAKRDAELFIGHHFEDALGGVSKEYIIKPNDQPGSMWKAGAQAVFEKKPTIDKKIAARVPAPLPPSSPAPAPARVRYLEDFIIRLISNPRKYDKYKRDRVSFFQDSNKFLMRTWFRWSRMGLQT